MEEIEFFLEEIENNITQARMDLMNIHMLAMQLSDIDSDSDKVPALKEEINQKFAKLREVLNNISHEDEQAENIIKKIRELI